MAESSDVRTVTLLAEPLTAESFAPYGQVICPSDDGVEFNPQHDARLELGGGTPRFYLMRLPHRGRSFHRITFHAKVTQCLGGLAPARPWYLVVASPTLDVARYPPPQDLRAFRVPPGVFVKLEKGTWHAGPLFDSDSMDFYNLELSNTNVVDHNTHDYAELQQLRFTVMD